jgi:protein-tyrosine phosphatase
MPKEKVAGCISISALGEPVADFVPHKKRYTALFGQDVCENDLSAMNPILKIKSGMSPLLCTHATKDRVVSIASHRAFADAYRAAGNECEFFEYPNSIREGLNGHCIWIPDSEPRRLIPEIESRIKAFMSGSNVKLPDKDLIKVLEPAQGSVVPLLTDAQKAYFDMPTAERRAKFTDVGFRKQLSRSGVRAPDGKIVRQSYWPKTVRLAWEPVKSVEAYVVTVKDAKKGETVVNETVAGSSLEIDNLEVAAEYSWTVTGGGNSGGGTFKTEDRAPRLVRFPGVPNVRDLGGWTGLGGRRVRQGMVYRSSGLNANAHREKIDSDEEDKPEGKPRLVVGASRVEGENGAYILKRFGIRSEIDLRSRKECFGMEGSPLGPSVGWFHHAASAYAGMQSERGREAFTKVFKVFLDEKNYPIDFHCIAGQDRTGSVAYVLEALLGADEDRLVRDWETTALWNRNVKFAHVNRYDKLVDVFKREFPADTVRESVEKYVLSLGFTQGDIEKFRSIMLE